MRGVASCAFCNGRGRQCRRIESVPAGTWTADGLPPGVTEAKREQLRAQKDSGLYSAYSDLIERCRAALSSPAASACASKTNLLAFLEPLCTSEHSAEVLVNTPLTSAIIQNLSAQNSALKVQAAHAIGLLVRHAKFIDMGFMSPGAPAVGHFHTELLATPCLATFMPIPSSTEARSEVWQCLNCCEDCTTTTCSYTCSAIPECL